jgi:hypothetical protein
VVVYLGLSTRYNEGCPGFLNSLGRCFKHLKITQKNEKEAN